ncbi:hypothetical protein [Thermococcus sp. JCM 11816]
MKEPPQFVPGIRPKNPKTEINATTLARSIVEYLRENSPTGGKYVFP